MSVDTLPPLTTPPSDGPAGDVSPAVARRPALGRWGVPAAVLVLLLLSLWLRTRAIHTTYWIDEGLSVGIASHPLSQIPHLLRQDGSPPLYYLILHVWMSVFGRGEVATHALSLIFGLLTIPAAYWLGARLFGRRAGLFCAILAAAVPYLNTYAQETRMYALLALLALVAAGAFVEVFVMRRRRYLPVFAVALAAALYTHNWALFLGLAAVGAFALCLYRSPVERRELLTDGAIAFGSVAILYAPWVPTVLYQAGHTGAPWDLPPVIWSLSQGLYSVVGGRGAAMAILLAGGSGLLALRQSRAGEERVKPAVLCLLVLGLGTLLVAWLYAKVTPAWAVRYLAVIVGPLILVAGVGLSRAGRLGIVALALTLSFWILDPVPTSRSAKSNVAQVAAALQPHLRPGMLVLSTQPEQVPTLAYYMPRSSHFGTPIGPVPDPRVVDWRDALARLRRSSVPGVLLPMLNSLAPGERVLLVVPIRFQKSPLWLKLIWRDSERWMSVLDHDRALRRVATSVANWTTSGVPVRATLYVQRTG